MVTIMFDESELNEFIYALNNLEQHGSRNDTYIEPTHKKVVDSFAKRLSVELGTQTLNRIQK